MRQLSDQTSVSFSVIREAINKLTEEGYLRVDSRRGVFVSKPKVAVRDIALVVTMLQQDYFNWLIGGIHEGLAGTSYRLVVETAKDDFDKQMEQLERLDRAFIAGVIISPPPFQRHASAIQDLLDRGLPCVQVTTMLDHVNAPAVITDEFEMGRQAIEMLVKAGHRRIGIIDNNTDARSFQELRLGIDRGLAPISQDMRSLPTVEGNAAFLDKDHPYRVSIEAAHSLFDRYPDVTAVLGITVNRALGAYLAAKERGMRVPEDLSIIGLGNDMSALDTFEIPLTMLTRPTQALGRRAAVVVQQMIEGYGSTPGNIQLSFGVRDRGSVGPPRS